MKPNRKQQIKKNLKGGKGRGGVNRLPESIGAPLNFPQARNIANQSARAEYAPTVNAIKQDIAGSRKRQGQINEWFQGLNNQINQSAAATDQSYAQANNALLAHAQAAANAAQATQGMVQANNNQMIGLTGADASLTAPIEAEQAGAANARQIGYGALAAPIAAAGANQAAYLRNTGINARREGIQQKQNEMRRRDQIKQDLTSARTSRAQKAVDNLYGPSGLRQQERDYRTQRAAFGLEKQTAAQDAAQAAASLQQGAQDDAIKNAIAQQNANTAAKNANTTAYNAHHPSTEKNGGRTPSQVREDNQDWKDATNIANNALETLEEQGAFPGWNLFQQILVTKYGIRGTIAAKIVQRLKQ